MTEQEIKEFLQWLGFTQELATDDNLHWFDPEGNIASPVDVDTDLPIMDLNFLFKWAVPKLEIEDDWRWEVLQEWFYNAMRNNNYKKDPTKSAIALFRAIQKVKERA